MGKPPWWMTDPATIAEYLKVCSELKTLVVEHRDLVKKYHDEGNLSPEERDQMKSGNERINELEKRRVQLYGTMPGLPPQE